VLVQSFQVAEDTSKFVACDLEFVGIHVAAFLITRADAGVGWGRAQNISILWRLSIS
jgi:hypothetical protein